MKKFVVMLLACLMIASCACADTVYDFNLYASIFGASEVKDGSESTIDGQEIQDFTSDDCRIVFASKDGKLKSIIVVGIGDKFLAYCASAIMQFDKSSENRTANYGNFLSLYLLSLNDDETSDDHMFTTVSGDACGIKKNGSKCQFTIVSLK